MLDRQSGSMAYVLRVSLVAALGGLLFGYDTGVINGAIGPLKAHFSLDATGEGWAAACALVGCAYGAALAGMLSDWLGRKKVLILCALLFLVSAVGTALPQNIQMFIIFRILGGFAVGAASMTSPMYIAEVSPAGVRGRMVSLNQLAIVTGFLVVYFVNYFIALQGDYAWNQQSGWRWMFGSEALPSLLLLVLACFLPESPRWLVKEGQPEKALQILTIVDGPAYAKSELREITDTIGQVREMHISKVLFSFRGRINRMKFIEACIFVATMNSFIVAIYVSHLHEAMDPTAVQKLMIPRISWFIINLWIFVALQVKRWHDRGKSAWMLLLNLVPVIGWIWAVIELALLQGELGINRYGGDPLEGRHNGGMQKWKYALGIAVALAILQQVTGINVFLYFGTEIFKEMGSEMNTALLLTILVGAVNLTFTVVAIWTVDRLGRKPLMVVGSAGMGICLLAMGLAAYFQQTTVWLLVFILGYIACFALSVGPVTWVILSEIFPTRIRGRAMAIATVCLWIANYVVSQTFPMMDKNDWLVEKFHHGFPFWIYSAFCGVLVVFVWRLVPETKGKTLEEIERLWLKKKEDQSG